MLFNQCVASCDEENEVLLNIVDFLDPLTVVLLDHHSFLQEQTSGEFDSAQTVFMDEASLLTQHLRLGCGASMGRIS